MDISLPVMTVGSNASPEGRCGDSPYSDHRINGHALVTDRAKAFEVGFDDYDTKP